MAEQGKLFFTLTLSADADLSDKQYHFMRLSGTKSTNQASNSTDTNYVGVLQNEPESGEQATVGRGGKMKVVAGGALSANDQITTNGSGRATGISSGTNDVVYGRVLEASSADGDVVTADIYQSPFVWPGIAV